MNHETKDLTKAEVQLDFGWAFRAFELGFFGVVLVASLALLVLVGGDAILDGSPVGFRSLLAMLLGAGGSLVALTGALNALKLIVHRAPALEVSEEGILNRTYWHATTLVPWSEVIDIRRTRYWWILEIVLRDPEAFRRRQILPIRMMMRLTSWLGIGTLPIYLPQFTVSRAEASRLLFEAIEARELFAIREQRLLEAAAARDRLPTEGEGDGA